jgi:hypothetical protein
MIDIYDVEGNVLMQAEITSSAKREEELSKSDYISLSWNSTEKVILPVGAYINHTYKIDKVREVTRQFLLLEAYEPTQTDEMSWKYTPEFQHPKMILSKVPFYVRTRNSQDEEIKQHVWSFVGTMHTIAEQLQDFLNKEVKFGNAGWTVHYDETNSNTINVSFSDNDFISALSAIVNAIGDNCEWHIDYDDEIIYIGKVLIGATPVVLEVGKNVGVPSINISKEGYYNAFSIFGGTRNITQVNSKGENVSSGDIRLQLDEGNGTITIDGKECPYSIDKYSTFDLRADKAKEPLFTKVLDFSQIFPSLNTYVYNVRGRVKYVLDKNNEKIPISYNTDDSVKEYKTFTIWYMRLAYPTTEKVEGKKIINTTIDDGVTHYWYDFEITDSLLVNGKNIGCSFEANFNKDALPSPLAGRGSNGSYVGFELTYHRDASSSHSSDDVNDKDFAVLAGDYEIVYQEDNDLIIPTNVAGMIVPKGETLPSLKCNITVLYNIAMADSIYIKDAQQRLLDAAIQEIQRLRSDLNNYTIKSYPQVFVEQNPCLQIGQKVTYDDGNGYTLSTRVLKLSTNIDYDFIQEITVGNQAIKGTITQLRDDVQSIIASGENGSGGSSYTEAQLRNLIARYGTSYFLSKQFNDTAQGLITFAKGLISDMLAKLNRGATFGTGGYKFDEKGNVVVDALSSLAFDEALERGFGVTKNSRGKYTLSVTDLMVWGKAVFNSLEIRKLYAVGGNVYLSGASSKLQHVSPVTDADGEVTGWKCYILGDDGTTATQNGWRKYDQAKCQTFDIKEGVYENVSNTYYWRLVTDVSTENETITETYTDADGKEQTRDLYDGKKFGWVILSKTDCESAGNDAPKAGDTIVLDGHRMIASGDADGRDQYNDESRTNVMMLETTGTEDGTLPRIVALTGIVDYRHWDGVNQYSNTVFILSPKKVVFVSSSFEWISASGDPITLVNFRGNWAERTEYRYYDQVSHNDSIWTCIVEKGKATTAEPSDTSKDWRKEISGDKGEDAVTYGVQLSSTYEVSSDDKKHAGIKVAYTKTTGMTVSSYGNVQVLGAAKVYADGTEIKSASDHLNSGYSRIIFDYYTFDGTNNTASIGTASVITVELLVGGTVVATANYSNGKQGDGVVMAYKHADTQPDAPTGTDPEYPGDGWSLSPDAATAGEKVTDVRYGGYESGTYDGNNKGTDATAKEWAEAEDDGRTWMKSPSGLSYNYGYAMMKVSFITQYDNTTVDVEIKAYSEQNYDLVEVWALDTAPSTGTSFRGQGLAHASGNGVEQAYSFTVAKAGRHFICVTYAKDISGDDNGDYGLFRLDLSDNEVAVSDTVWMSQAKVSGGKCVLPWSTPVKINGADGIGAFEILCDPETIVIDTDDNGLATGLDNAYASLMCLRDGKEVSGVTYKMGSCVNCEATVNTNTHVVAITRVDKQSVTVDGQTVEVSCTNGSVTVSVTDPTTKTTYVKTIPFSVNVAKFNGGLKADNKTLKSQYTELSKNSATKDDLKQYDSKIEQTARNISLKVMEKSVGRRNLLPGSAFRKQGEGCSIVQDGQDAINGICINGGYDGVNCARLRNERDAGAAYPRISWDGGRNSNVKVAKGKKYTLSFWAKRLSSTEGGYEISTQFFLQDGANGYARPYGALKMGSFTVKSQGEWEFIQDIVTIPSDAKSNYMEVCICLGLLRRGMAEILVCRPMLEEGEEYNGWTLSEQDYDYVGGNLLDGTGTLAKTGNVETLNPDNVTQGGMGESASIRAVLSPTDTNIDIDFLQFSTDGMGLKANEDYVLSFYAKAYTNPGRLQCYLYPSEGYTNTEEIEGGYDYFNPSDGSLQSGGIVPGTTWKRYWVHWRPTKADPKHVLFRLLRGGNDRDTYSSYTTYAVDDVVLYGGTYYRCIKAGQGNTPSSSSSYWEATWYGISLSKPKLEVGATMTEWTEKRSDMVDKQALYATGINIDIKEITLTASNTKFRDNDGNEMAVIDHDGLRATKIATTDNGGGHTEISGNSTVWFQKDGVTPGIAVFYDAAGVPHLAFYGTDGKQKYDIGPSGLQSLISSTQQAHSDTAYLRLATSAVKDYNSALSFDWLYVAKGQQADLCYIWRKQIPTTDASKNYDIYDGCVFTKNYYNTTNRVSWPNPNFLLPNGWYTEPNDGNLPMKLHMVDNEGVLDPTQTVYYQTFYYYEGGKVARTVRAYMKRTTSSQLVSKFEYAGSYYEI